MFKKTIRAIEMWNMTRLIRAYDRKNAKLRKKYCHKGYHKLHMNRVSHSGGNIKRTVNITYLACEHCNYRFFATMKDKERYMEHFHTFKNLAKEDFSALLKSFSSAPLKKSKGVGQDKGRDSSASIKPLEVPLPPKKRKLQWKI